MKLVPAITAALLAATASLIAVAAGAETLPEALAEAYETNPQLAVQRAIVRQADELVPIALGAGRPTLDATAAEQQNGLDFNNNGRTMSSGLTINQSLFRGGRTRSATNAADNRILAARARLRAVEDNVLLGVVTAYADVLRYAAVVDLNTNQVKVLGRELQASRDRFEVGDLTRTDVAQSDARLANAQSNLVIAQGQLNTARNAYARVVGHYPGTLAPLPPLPALPGTSGQAVDLANVNNPALVAARFDEAAARYDVSTIERERLPSVGLGLGANYQRFDGGGGGGRFVQQGGFFTQNAGVQLSVPLYQAGVVGARIRSAQAVRSQSMEQIGLVGRQVAETAQNALLGRDGARGHHGVGKLGRGEHPRAGGRQPGKSGRHPHRPRSPQCRTGTRCGARQPRRRASRRICRRLHPARRRWRGGGRAARSAGEAVRFDRECSARPAQMERPRHRGRSCTVTRPGTGGRVEIGRDRSPALTRPPEPPAIGGVPASIAAIMAAIRNEVVAPARATVHAIPGVPTTDGRLDEVPFHATPIAGVPTTAMPTTGAVALPADIDATVRDSLTPLLRAWLVNSRYLTRHAKTMTCISGRPTPAARPA